MLSSIAYQGYTITAPEAPSEAGSFTPHPTPLQVVTQVDNTFVWTPPHAADIEAVTGEAQPNELVEGTLAFQCYWDSIFNVVAQDTQVQQSVTYTTGVTTSDSDTKTFGLALGVEADIIPGVAASLSATFSKAETHTVTLSESRSVTQSFTALPGTTLQVWQLHAQYIAEYEHGGETYRYVLEACGSVENGVILALTHPEATATA